MSTSASHSPPSLMLFSLFYGGTVTLAGVLVPAVIRLVLRLGRRMDSASEIASNSRTKS